MSAQLAADLRAAAHELRSLGRSLLSASYEGPEGGPPSEQGWPHFDCEDILGEYVIKRAAALEAAADDADRQAAYDAGEWCGECQYGVAMDPPCCTQSEARP